MPNILDYLDWRGDLDFNADPFNEVDNLILSKLVTLDYSDIIPENGEKKISEVAAEYFAKYGEEDKKQGVISSAGLVPLLKKAVESKRFGDMTAIDYVNRVEVEIEKQFAAVTFGLNDGTRFVSYRGTDDNLIAWKEDFNLISQDIVPAQIDAAEYLQRQGDSFDGKFRVGGHSKGGNLAVFAAMSCKPELQDRLLEIFNNDGPGFKHSVKDVPEYMRVQPRIRTIVPQYSIVGMLLHQDDDFEIVYSNIKGAGAHDGFSWELVGPAFLRAEGFSLRSQIFDKAMHAMGGELDEGERRAFTDAFFNALGATGAQTLTELSESGLTGAFEIAKRVFKDPEQREKVVGPIEAFAREYFSVARQSIPVPEIAKSPIKTVKKALNQMIDNQGIGKPETEPVTTVEKANEIPEPGL
ncbi:MAG: DUF2974 domain-containing protein [Ruminococcaceae bacterium]|nr:DUF2974 domain-containing protein [Oscillospiraceae bacterium]